MPDEGRVWIVMATYNGARYLAEQIASLRAQSFVDWTLLIRDDMSRDGTAALIKQAGAEDTRIKVMHDGRGNLGAVGNFAALMESALAGGADYLFFVDQDDVWHPDKLAIMLDAMRVLEQAAGNDIPLLVHSDLTVVDETLLERAESFVSYSRLSPATADLGVLLCQNQVTGCAAVVNRKLLELACPVPAQVLMHDWWVALLAAAAGKVGYVPERLVRYRQHDGNVLGAISLWSRVIKLSTSSLEWKRFAKIVRGTMVQARLLRQRLAERSFPMSSVSVHRLEAYANMLSVQPLKRPRVLRSLGIGKPGRAKGWVFSMVVMMMRGDGGE